MMTLYKNKKEQGADFIDVNRMQMSFLLQIMRFSKKSSVSADKILRCSLLQ